MSLVWTGWRWQNSNCLEIPAGNSKQPVRLLTLKADVPRCLTIYRFTEVFFLDASTADTIQAGLKNIALTQSIGSDHEDALLWLASCSTEWLLVFDNADDPKLNLFNFIPQSTCGNILITSRNPQLHVHAPGAHHRVSDLEQEAAVQLLLVSAAEPATSENEMLATEIVKVCFVMGILAFNK
jgi:hypothetical protein